MSATAVLLVILVLVLLGGGAGFYYMKTKQDAMTTNVGNVQAATAPGSTIQTTGGSTPTVTIPTPTQNSIAPPAPPSAPTTGTNLAPASGATDGYSFNSGMDSGGSDLRREWPASVPKLKSTCSADTACQGFNSNGYLKRAIKPSSQWDNLGPNNVAWDPNTLLGERGLYVKQ